MTIVRCLPPIGLLTQAQIQNPVLAPFRPVGLRRFNPDADRDDNQHTVVNRMNAITGRCVLAPTCLAKAAAASLIAGSSVLP